MATARPLATVPPTSWPGLAVSAPQVLPGLNGFLRRLVLPALQQLPASTQDGCVIQSAPHLTPTSHLTSLFTLVLQGQ